MRKLSVTALAVMMALAATPAHAYVGPGLGVGVIAVIFGIVGSILLAIVSVLWYPIKRMIGKKPKSTVDAVVADEATESDT